MAFRSNADDGSSANLSALESAAYSHTRAANFFLRMLTSFPLASPRPMRSRSAKPKKRCAAKLRFVDFHADSNNRCCSMKRDDPAHSNLIAERLIARFGARDATIGVIGLGYVGLPLLCRFAEAGFRTLGLDIDEQKIRVVSKGESYLSTVSGTAVRQAVDRGLVCSADYAHAA